MSALASHVDPGAKEFIANRAAMEALVADLREKTAEIRLGGDEAARERHSSRGKMLIRERIRALLDREAELFEVAPFAGYRLYDGPLPAGGIVTGIGSIAGRDCMVIANDATVKGGTYFPITVKKHLRAQAIAAENQLPCVYLVDSGGAFLPLQDQVFPGRDHFGRIFFNQARMSASGLPQIAAVLGSCTAGGAYVPAMCEQSIIVKGQGTIFLAGPPLVKAATGETVSAEDLGGADTHGRLSGLVDYIAKDDADAMRIIRSLVRNLDAEKYGTPPLRTAKSPVHDPAELNGIIPTDVRWIYNVHEVIARIVDGSEFDEFKAAYGTTLVCGFARIHGHLAGIIANNGILLSEAALKGTHFIELCGQRGVPLIFLQNTSGFMVGRKAEAEGIAKNGAKLVMAVACAEVPKLTIIIGGSFGAGNYAMCGRAYDPRFLFMWPNARISVMGGEQAAQVLLRIRRDASAGDAPPDEQERRRADEIRKQYSAQGHPYYAGARLWDDGVIAPVDTRDVIGRCLGIVTRVPAPPTRFGIFRM
jgi:3-methylcrotonyl-CoA carboxylase beta subunit